MEDISKWFKIAGEVECGMKSDVSFFKYQIGSVISEDFMKCSERFEGFW